MCYAENRGSFASNLRIIYPRTFEPPVALWNFNPTCWSGHFFKFSFFASVGKTPPAWQRSVTLPSLMEVTCEFCSQRFSAAYWSRRRNLCIRSTDEGQEILHSTLPPMFLKSRSKLHAAHHVSLTRGKKKNLVTFTWDACRFQVPLKVWVWKYLVPKFSASHDCSGGLGVWGPSTKFQDPSPNLSR